MSMVLRKWPFVATDIEKLMRLVRYLQIMGPFLTESRNLLRVL